MADPDPDPDSEKKSDPDRGKKPGSETLESTVVVYVCNLLPNIAAFLGASRGEVGQLLLSDSCFQTRHKNQCLAARGKGLACNILASWQGFKF